MDSRSSPDVRQVLVTLGDVQQLLVNSEWRPRLEAIAGRLGSDRESAEGLHELGDLFRGVGSLNDIFLCEENQNVPVGLAPAEANRRLDALLDDLFAQLFPAETGSSEDGLPSRIRHAFGTGGPGAA